MYVVGIVNAVVGFVVPIPGKRLDVPVAVVVVGAGNILPVPIVVVPGKRLLVPVVPGKSELVPEMRRSDKSKKKLKKKKIEVIN